MTLSQDLLISIVTSTMPNGDTEGKAVCTCGFQSGTFPWADYLAEVAIAHASAHRYHGTTVDMPDFEDEIVKINHLWR